MRKLFLVIAVLSLATSSYAFLEGLTEGIQNISSAVTSLQPVLEMFKTTSSSKMGDLQQRSGFKTLQTSSDFGSGTVHESKLPKMFAFWAKSLPVDPIYKTKLSSFYEGAEWEEFLDPYATTSQDLKFADGKGKIYNMRCVLQRHESNPQVIKWEKVLWSAKFEVPAPFMIVTKSKANFFSSKTTDEVKYFQATLNPEHIAALRNLAIPFLSIATPNGQSLIERMP